MATVEKSIDVEVPVRTAYNQWTQFEEFPEFMHNVVSVSHTDDSHLHWVARVGAATREWDAEILEQSPDQVIAWRATDGTPNSGLARFEALSPDRTRVHLLLEVAEEHWTDRVAGTLGVLDTVVEADLERFKEFIEARGVDGETGAWRGEVHADLGEEDLSPPRDPVAAGRVGADLAPVP